MPTSKKAKKSNTRQANRKRQSKSVKPFVKIPEEDLNWALEQNPRVYKLWGECWCSDRYGSRWMPLKTSLKDRNLRYAKKVLREAGLFDFQTKMQILEGKQYYETYVINLHGVRTTYQKGLQQDLIIENAEGGTENAEGGTENAGGGTDSSAPQPSNNAKSVSSESLIIASRTPQEHLKGVLEACEADKISASLPQEEGESGIRSAPSAELMVGEICGGQAPHTPHAPPPPT